jgi:outer membrane protein TolC
MYFGILLAVAIGWALAASAQPSSLPTNPRRISLQECLELALARNLDLQIEHLSASIARDNLWSSYGAYVPAFSFSARHDEVSQPLQFDPHKANLDFPYDLRSDKAIIGLDGKVPFGLSYDLNGLAGKREARTDFNSSTNVANDYFFGVRNTNDYFASSGLTLRQHLLKDFWIDQEWLTVLVRRRDLKISQQLLRFQIMKTVLAVELAYYELLASRQRIRVNEQAVELKQQLVKEMKRRVEVGDLPPLDSEQAETQFQNALAALANAHEDFFDRQNALKNLFTDSFEAWANIDLEPADALEAVAVEPNRSESFRKALKDRPDLAEARLIVERNEVQVHYRLNQLFPSLDLIGHYGSDAVDPDSTRSAINDAIRFRDPSYFYGASVTLPLSNLAERSNYHASKAAKQIAELQVKKAEQDVLMQVSLWVHRVQSRFSQVGYTRKARSYAESALAVEQKKLQNGLSTTFVVLELQESVTSARTAEIQALADYNKALAQLAFSEGSIMERNKLTLDVK